MTSRGEMLRISGSALLAGSALGFLDACATAVPSAAARTQSIALASIDTIVKNQLAAAPAVSVGIYLAGTEITRNYALGSLSSNYSERTVYGIGSNTKVFTSSLLAYQCTGPNATRTLDDLAVSSLPPAVGAQGKAVKSITLRELATHTSSFPDFVPVESDDTLFIGKPPPATQVQWWIDWDNTLATIGDPNPCLRHTPGTCWNYSDWAFITLGFAIADSNSTAAAIYPQLLADVLTTPLGLSSTSAAIALDVQGHDVNGKVVSVPPADLKSNARDLLTFLKANLGELSGVPGRLQQALFFAQQVQWDGAKFGDAKNTMGLAWQLPPPKSASSPQLVWKNGEAGGFTSFLGMLPSKRMAIAILTNSDAVNPTGAGTEFLKEMTGEDLPPAAPS